MATENMTNDVKVYVHDDTQKIKKSFRYGMIARVLVVAFALGYLGFLNGQIDEILDEKNLAEVALAEGKRNLPKVATLLRENLTAAAPDIVEKGIDLVIDRSVPMIREQAEKMFGDYSRELAEYGTQQTVAVFREIVKEHKEAIQARKDTEPGWYTPDRVAQKLSDDMESKLGMRLSSRWNDKPEETGAAKLDATYTALKNINFRLKRLADNKDPSRKEELGRRFISSWWSMMSRAEQAAN